MTINRSRGQNLKHVGMYRNQFVFYRRQLYVVISRVSFKEGITIAIEKCKSEALDDYTSYTKKKNL